MLGQQGRQALLAEERAATARFDEPVGRGEEHVAGPEGRLALLVAGRRLDAERHAGGLERLVAVGAQQPRRAVPGVGPAQRAVGDHGHEGGHEARARQPSAQQPVGLGEDVAGALGVPGPRLDEEADHRAQRGDLEALAGDVADEHRQRPARQRPDAEDVAAADVMARGLVDEPELEAGDVVGAAGHVPARERGGDAALAVEVERVGDRAGGGPRQQLEARELLGAVVAGLLVAGGEHAEQARPERDGDVDEGADPLALDERVQEAIGVGRIAHIGLPGARDVADHALAHAEARAHALVGEADRRDGAQVGRRGLVAPQGDLARADELARLLDDRRVDGVELERGAHGAHRLVDLALLAPAAFLAFQQLGPFEGQGGEVGEDLHQAQLLRAERALGRAGGDREHSEGSPARGAHRAGDERRGAIPVPGAPGGLGLELLLEALAQRGRALPLLEAAQEQRLPRSIAASVTPGRSRSYRRSRTGVIASRASSLANQAAAGRITPASKSTTWKAQPLTSSRRRICPTISSSVCRSHVGASTTPAHPISTR